MLLRNGIGESASICSRHLRRFDRQKVCLWAEQDWLEVHERAQGLSVYGFIPCTGNRLGDQWQFSKTTRMQDYNFY